MNITKENAARLGEIAGKMVELLNEYKGIVRHAMNSHESESFRYNTLAHLEPGLNSEHDWVVGSQVRGLDQVAEDALEEVLEECPDCGSPLGEDGTCDCESEE